MDAEAPELDVAQGDVEGLATDLAAEDAEDEVAGEAGQGDGLRFVFIEGENLGVGAGVHVFDAAGEAEGLFLGFGADLEGDHELDLGGGEPVNPSGGAGQTALGGRGGGGDVELEIFDDRDEVAAGVGAEGGGGGGTLDADGEGFGVIEGF